VHLFLARMQSAESKKEEFQKYLEKSGVIDALTKVLVALYESNERPANAIDFVRDSIGCTSQADLDKLKTAVADMTKQLAQRDELIGQLKRQVEDHRAATAPAAAQKT